MHKTGKGSLTFFWCNMNTMNAFCSELSFWCYIRKLALLDKKKNSIPWEHFLWFLANTSEQYTRWDLEYLAYKRLLWQQKYSIVMMVWQYQVKQSRNRWFERYSGLFFQIIPNRIITSLGSATAFATENDYSSIYIYRYIIPCRTNTQPIICKI